MQTEHVITTYCDNLYARIATRCQIQSSLTLTLRTRGPPRKNVPICDLPASLVSSGTAAAQRNPGPPLPSDKLHIRAAHGLREEVDLLEVRRREGLGVEPRVHLGGAARERRQL